MIKKTSAIKRDIDSTSKKPAVNPVKKAEKKTKQDAKVKIEALQKEISEKDLKPASDKEVTPPKNKPAKKKKYYETVGRRKTSVARIRLWTTHPSESAEAGYFVVNDKKHTEYFSIPELIQVSESSLSKMKSMNRFQVSAKVSGGGISSQAEAIRHGIARALVKFDQNFRKKLKKAGYLIRDPRMRERKKYGLKRARRAPQWTKR